MGVGKRIRFGLAQLGTKPGGKDLLSGLLAADDLPGRGWEQLDERAWRTGMVERDAEWAARARQINSVTTWRSFEESTSARWMWVQVVPLACEGDVWGTLGDLARLQVEHLEASGRTGRIEDR